MYCNACGDRFIHQGARRGDESASPFGQWVHDALWRWFTSGDVDQYIRRHFPGEPTLLRWIEHKSPGQKFGPEQRQALADFDAVIRHAIECPESPLAIRGGSGVFVVYSGFVDGAPTGIAVERMSDGGLWRPKERRRGGQYSDEEAVDRFARWLIESGQSPMKQLRRAS